MTGERRIGRSAALKRGEGPGKVRRPHRIAYWIRVLGAISAALIIVGCAADANGQVGTNSAGYTTVNFGSVGSTTDAGVILGQSLGYFKDEKINVVFHKITNAPALTAAVVSGQLQVVGIAQSPALFRAFSEKLGIKLVGDKQSITPYLSATHLVVRKQFVGATLQQTLNNLKGKTVAVPSLIDNTDYELDQLLQQNGISYNSVKRQAIPFPDMVGALSSGAVDAAVILEPFLTEALDTGTVSNVSSFSSLDPGKTVSLVQLVYSKAFVANTSVAQRFMDAYMRGVRAYDNAFLAGTDRTQIINLLASAPPVALPAATVSKLYLSGLDPDQGAEPGALQTNDAFLSGLEHFWISQGYLQDYVPPQSMWDLTFAENADRLLGPYKYPNLTGVQDTFGLLGDSQLSR
jgi:NitT/TauT family transport system substrate-binding protein